MIAIITFFSADGNAASLQLQFLDGYALIFEHKKTFHKVPELTQIAGPAISQTFLNHPIGEGQRRFTETLRQPVHEMFQQKRNFFAPLTQWRYVDGECIEPVIKVFS